MVQRSVLIGLTLILLAGCGGGGTSPSQVAAAVGAATCDNSGFYLQGTSTGAKDAIYDCRFRTGLPKCVTYSGNIASDATAEVSLLFARSLNTRRPVCLKWHAEALHQSQVRAAKRAALKDLYSGLFGNSRKAVTKAEREVGKNPVKGYRDLANALITNNDLPGAIAALRSYLLLRQTDASAWTQLAGCEKQQGDVYAERYQQAQQQSRPSASRLYKRAISYYKDSLAAFQEAANYSPRSELPSAELAVSNAAQLAGQSSVELAALKRYVELAPDSPSLTEIEAACTQLGGSCVPKHKK